MNQPTNPDLAADSAKLSEQASQSGPVSYNISQLERATEIAEETGYQRAMAEVERHVLGTELMSPEFHTSMVIARCQAAREQRLVQVVVERAAERCKKMLAARWSLDEEMNEPYMNPVDAIRQLSSPENVAALIAEAKGEK